VTHDVARSQKQPPIFFEPFGKARALLGVIMRHKTVFRDFSAVSTNKTMRFFPVPLACRRQRADFCAQTQKVSFAFLLALIFFAPAWAQSATAQDQNASLFGLPSRQHLFGTGEASERRWRKRHHF
jgi:hypothetical protein